MYKKLLRFYNKKEELRIYFITMVIKDRIQFFDEKIIKEIFTKRIKITQYFYDFVLYAFTIQKDHVHLLIQPLLGNNISQIIRFIKQNFAQNINNLLNKRIVDADACPRRMNQKYSEKQYVMIKEYQNHLYELQKNINLGFEYFKWQKSYHDHIIRDYKDFKSHYLYIKYNTRKHKYDFK